ncbi:hypothetical protein B0H17DRAFT_1216144 [Mycena rosella]|uniref:Uncharacterized protein n=1 Tax=Mycena rosella TaxID=1033263 RepID=A0AAD7C9V5_MYCRO|nr:hypothetical protein B0H17DRAFT_1216144 [Mycena rosella]
MLDLEELVNMAEEQVSEQLTDEEIKNADQEKCAGEQDREVNGGDDDYVDKDPRPTRGEVLQASAILRRYVKESGDTFAQQMETILGSIAGAALSGTPPPHTPQLRSAPPPPG